MQGEFEGKSVLWPRQILDYFLEYASIETYLASVNEFLIIRISLISLSSEIINFVAS